MTTTPTETTTTPETAATSATAAPGVAAEKVDKSKEMINIMREADERAKEYESIYGKYPTQDEVVKKFQAKDAFQDKSYDEIIDILKNGAKKEGKEDKRLQDQNLHHRLNKHVGTQPETTSSEIDYEPVQEAQTEQEAQAEQETQAEQTKAMKEELNIEPVNPKIKETERWKQEDEDARPGSKKTTQAAEEKPAKEVKGKKEKPAKGKSNFRKNTGKVIARPFKTSVKLVKTAAKTVRAPVSLSSYMLADLGEKDKAKRTGWKDRRAGYKKIWKGK